MTKYVEIQLIEIAKYGKLNILNYKIIYNLDLRSVIHYKNIIVYI